MNISLTQKPVEVEVDPRKIYQWVLIALPVLLLLILISIGLVGEGSQQFSDLAQAFLHGQTHFLHPIGGLGQDPVFYKGKIFWDEGAFPAVILIPFVALFDIFNRFFFQGYIKWALVLGTLFFVYKIARKLKYDTKDGLVLALGFCLASVYIGIASVSSGWLYAQVVNTFLMFWAFYEFFVGKKRYWLIGVLCACVMMTRITATPMVLFFAAYVWYSQSANKEKYKNLLKLAAPLVVAALIIGLYNYQRFGNPLNNGNQYQLLSQGSSLARSMGVFSLNHIPTNLYNLLLRGPNTRVLSSNSWSLKFPFIVNNPLGLSIFMTSPFLLYLFTKKWSAYSKEAKYLLFATLISAILVLSYFGDGANQFGYRYSMDFFPEIFIVFMILYKKFNSRLSTGMKTLLMLSALFNFYLITTYIN